MTLAIIGVCLTGAVATAQTFVGTVLAVKGDVNILHIPAPHDAGPFAKFKGKQYAYQHVKIGEKVNPGEIILSGTNGKVRIVYPNGDSFFVGSGSAFIAPTVLDVHASNNPRKDNSVVKMYFGRFRALISKTGPRNHLRVVTPDAIAGVRGTDFFARSNAAVGTQLTVLRGAVAFRNASNSQHPIVVKSGYSAAVYTHSKSIPQAVVATREALFKIHKQSELKVNPRAVATLPKPEQQEIHKLQKKEFQSVMADIKNHNPALYQNLKKQDVKSVEQVNKVVVARLWHNAPAVNKHKPTRAQLRSAGRHVYKRYYHPHPHRQHPHPMFHPKPHG